jgi:lysophospholipase L1-like esterase
MKAITSYIQAKKYADKFNKPKTVEQVIEKMLNKKPVTIVCYGDSITWGYVPTTGVQTANPYPAYLQTLLRDYYGYTGITVINQGNSGKQSDEFASDSYVNAVTAANPDMVIFMCGINDCRGGTSGGAVVPVEDYKTNISVMVSKLNYPFIFMTPTFFQDTEDKKSRFNQYVQAMKEMAKKLSVKLVDLNAVVLRDLELREIAFEDVAPDNVHYTDAYYKKLAEFVFALGLCSNNIVVSSEKFISPLDSLFRWKNNISNYFSSAINPLKKNLWLDNAIANYSDLTLFVFIDSNELALQTMYVTNVSTSPSSMVEINGVSYPQYMSSASGQTIWKLREKQIPLSYGLNKIVYKTSNVTPGKLLNLIYGTNIVKNEKAVFGEEKKFVGSFDIKADTAAVQKRTKLVTLKDNNFKKLTVKFTPSTLDSGIAFGTGSVLKDGKILEYPLFLVLHGGSNVVKLYSLSMNNNTALLNADAKLNFTEMYASALTYNMGQINTLTVTLTDTSYVIELNGVALYTLNKTTFSLGVLDVWGYSINTSSCVVNEISVSS